LSATPPADDASGDRKTVGGYEVGERLGQGAIGAVFRARQVSVDRTVALKILNPRLSRKPEFVARFLREARSAARLSHPNIVQAIDAGQASGYHYFALEFVEGPDLATVLRRDGRLAEPQALQIGRDIARALGYAHRAGLLHRDVKPGNILLAADHTPKLADLGLARETTQDQAGTDVTQAGTALGTPDYMAPEQVRGESALDGRCDVYGLGATLYHMLTGAPPYVGGTREEVMALHLTAPVPNPRQAVPQLSPAAAAVVRRAMAKDRDHRYATADAMADDLDRALAGEAVVAPRIGAPRPSTGPLRGVRAAAGARPATQTLRGVGTSARRAPASKSSHVGVIVAAAALVVLVGGGLAVWAIRRSNGGRDDGAAAAVRDARLVAAVEETLRRSPDHVRENLGEIDRALAQVEGPAARRRLEELRAGVLERGRATAAAAFAAAKQRAADFAGRGNYDAAITAMRRIQEPHRSVVADEVRAEIARLRARAEGEVGAALADARGLARAGEVRAALARLDELQLRVTYMPRRAEIEQLRRTLEADVKAGRTPKDLARGALEKLLDEVDPLLRAGKVVEAGRLAVAGTRAEELKVLGDELKQVRGVFEILLDQPSLRRMALIRHFTERKGREVDVRTVAGGRSGQVRRIGTDELVLGKQFVINGEERFREVRIKLDDLAPGYYTDARIGWTPKTADGQMARALLAYAAGDAARMAKHLAAAQRHPLFEHYETRLRRTKATRSEVGAEEAFEELRERFGDRPRTEDESKRLLAAIDAYEDTYRLTAFGVSKQGALRRMRRRAAPVYAAWPFDAADARRRREFTAQVLGVPLVRTIELGHRIRVQLTLIPAGEFVMGSPANEKGREPDEGPAHRVRLTRPFYMGLREINRAQWAAVMGARIPERTEQRRIPQGGLSWQDCQRFVAELNEQTEERFRLPTEAEWEYACRAGAAGPLAAKRAGGGADPRDGRFEPNAFGLYAMHDGVREWCADRWSAYGGDAGAETDPAGAAEAESRVLRGGDSRSPARSWRSANRHRARPDEQQPEWGMRVLMDAR
jgi:serine/threonine-protein kinase